MTMTRRRFYGKWLLDRQRFSSPWVGRHVCVRTDGKNESRRACPELVERGRLNFRPVQIKFEKRLGSSTTLYGTVALSFVIPSVPGISYFTALTSATYVV